MAKDLGDLAKSMNRYAVNVEKNAPRVVGEIVKSIAPILVYATPVDTSRARADWVPSIGAPSSEVLIPRSESPSSPSAGASTAISSIRKVADDYKGEAGGVFITNNLEYITELNKGSSSQAPAGFVEKSVLAAVRAVKTVKLLDDQ